MPFFPSFGIKRHEDPGGAVPTRVSCVIRVSEPSAYHSGATDGSSAFSAVTFTSGMNRTMRSDDPLVRTS